MANATIGEAVPLEEEAGTARGKREAEEDAGDGGDGGEDEVEERCRVAMWVSDKRQNTDINYSYNGDLKTTRI